MLSHLLHENLCNRCLFFTRLVRCWCVLSNVQWMVALPFPSTKWEMETMEWGNVISNWNHVIMLQIAMNTEQNTTSDRSMDRARLLVSMTNSNECPSICKLSWYWSVKINLHFRSIYNQKIYTTASSLLHFGNSPCLIWANDSCFCVSIFHRVL